MTNPEAQFTNLLDWMYRDPASAKLFSIESCLENWIKVEIALAESHNELGLLPDSALIQIKKLRNLKLHNFGSLRDQAINVGYPIIGMLEIMNENLPESARGLLHVGATTQDIMDTALAVQISDVRHVLIESLQSVGDLVANLVTDYAQTPMPGRTHGKHAVPITLGMKLAVYLSELLRHHVRISRAFDEAACVSFFGAGGTSAASSPHAGRIRSLLAVKLGLNEVSIPWHASRDRLLELILQCASLNATLTRFAREVIDLSRSEIEELSEPGGRHKGASSTMPQKRNPVMSEALVGVAQTGIFNAQLMMRAAEVNHERAAGEWQIEWKAIPEVMISTVSALKLTKQILAGIEIRTENMERNLRSGQDLILAEAYMIGLAKTLGREEAHNLVYIACRLSETESISLPNALVQLRSDVPTFFKKWPISPEDYLGDTSNICTIAIKDWRTRFPK